MFGLMPRREKAKVAPPMPYVPNEFMALFDRFFNAWPMMVEPNANERFWNLELKENEKEVVVRAEVPGFEATDLNVELRNNFLFIRAGKKHEEKGELAEWAYERVVELPVETDPAKAAATYRNGVLELHLPKVEAVKPLRIPVT